MVFVGWLLVVMVVGGVVCAGLALCGQQTRTSTRTVLDFGKRAALAQAPLQLEHAGLCVGVA